MAERTQTDAQQEREKYVMAFNKTMIDIWKERLTLLDVRDTDRLLHSPASLSVRHDGRFFEVQLSQEFLEYGLWQDYGVGRETPRGNSGMLGYARDGYLNTFTYNVQPGQKMKIGIEGDNKATRLFINGKMVEELNIQDRWMDKEGKTRIRNVRTLVFPLEKAGNFKSKITNLKVWQK